MSDTCDVGMFLTDLYRVTSFEDTAELLLGRMTDSAAATLAPAPGSRPATLLRGMVHLRPDEGYRAVAVRELDERSGGAGGPEARVLPSLTAWSWVADTSGPVLLDVLFETARGADGAELERSSRSRSDFRSRGQLLGRHATHIMGWPLRRPGKRSSGFVSLELSIEMADDSADVGVPRWPELATSLQTLVDVAAPFLCELPRASGQGLSSEPGLPVIGAAMRELVDLLRLFAATDDTLLLLGETGVGKSQLARWCWKNSSRADQRFVTARLTGAETLRDGTLFGWKKGAFTGASDDRRGLVAEASGGTMFIDEVDKLSLDGQATLLELLDDGRYRALGDDEERQADIRFIVGSNADLEKAVEEGRFLEDLYYRIRVVPVTLPPLRERRDEIVRWAEFLVTRLHEEQDRGGGAHLEAAASALLEGQSWPGNVRMLHSVVTRAYRMATQEAGDGDVNLSAVHVERALALDRPRRVQGDALWQSMERAAAAFVSEAVQRDPGLALDLADAFRGFVLQEATARVGERDAFRVLDQIKSLKSSYHRKILDRERKKVEELARALGRPVS